METRIKHALRALRSAISETDGDAIFNGIEDLDRLAGEARGQIDPRLLHFLERRSYEKAWEWLESREPGRSELGMESE